MIITRSILSFAPRHRCRFKGIVLPGVQGYKLQDTSYKRTLSVFHVSLLLVNTNTCESRLGVWRERERDNGLPGKALRSGIKRSDPSPGSSADLQSIVSQVTNIGFLRRMDIFRKPSAKGKTNKPIFGLFVMVQTGSGLCEILARSSALL